MISKGVINQGLWVVKDRESVTVSIWLGLGLIVG